MSPPMDELGFLPPCSFSSEKFLDALLSNAQSTNQGNFCVIITVETRYVPLVRAGHGLLRLHYLNGVGHPRAETVAGLNQRRLRQIDVAAGNIYLFSGRLQVQQRRAHVGIDLRPQIVQTLAALLEFRVGLQNIAVNSTTLKDRNR